MPPRASGYAPAPNNLAALPVIKEPNVRTENDVMNLRPILVLATDAPDFRRVQPVGSVVALPVLAGLHHRYFRV